MSNYFKNIRYKKIIIYIFNLTSDIYINNYAIFIFRLHLRNIYFILAFF